MSPLLKKCRTALGLCALLLPVVAVHAAPEKTVLTDEVLAHHAAVVHPLNCTITAPQSFRISSHATAELLQMLPVGSSVK